jgi:Carbohydrate binding module (family 6)/Secretion system C-terminal sorting domain
MKQRTVFHHQALLSYNARLFSFLNKISEIHASEFKKIFSILFFFICITGNSQTLIGRQKVDQFQTTSWGTLTYGLTWLPTDYNTTTTKYPLIIFLHGTGEAGTGISGLYNLIGTGLPQIIADGFNVEATNPADGQNYKFIVVSPQAPEWSYSYSQILYILPDILNRYRVDPSMIYITGLSAGGGGTWSSLLHDDNFTQKFAAALPVSSVDANDPAEEVNLPYISSRNGVKLWTICGQYDAWLATAYRYQNIVNSNSPVVPMVVTEIPGASHSAAAWNTAYSPSWRSNTFNLNVFEWMLKNRRGSTQVSNQPPIDNAGLDKTITLPTNSVTLTGSGSDPDGTIKSYSWSKISGPSQYTITSPSSASTTVTGLVQGIYIFRLTVTDNAGATATDDVQVTVLGAANIPPVAMAGPDQTITLPTNSVSLTGSGTDADGSVISYNWSKISGPTQYAIDNSNIADPVISNLVAGTYTFRLTVSDNQGASATDDMNIVVNSSSSVNNIPGRIEAENYSTMSGVQIEGADDVGGGFAVGWIDQGDWMDYNVNVTTSGTYTVNFRVATPFTASELELRTVDGTVLLTLNLPATSNFVTWETVSGTISLAAGAQTLRLYSSNTGKWDINWFEFISVANSSSSSNNIPGTIEAENYSAMYGVQTEATGDGGAGLDVGYIDLDDWMDYSVNVATAGTYTVNFRIATPNTGAQLQLRKADGTILLTNNLPVTGAWQTWQTVSATVSLSAGAQTLRLYSSAVPRWNINWFEFISGVSNPPPSITKYIKVNIYAQVPYNSSEWNNWDVDVASVENKNSGQLKYSDGTSSGVSIILSYSETIVDNESNYGSGMAPAEVLRFSSYSASPRTLLISGLSPSKKYNLEFYASRSINPGNNTEFRIDQISDTISTYDNFTDKAVLTNLAADAQGQIVVNIINLNSYNYINGFTIVEYDDNSSRSASGQAMNEQTPVTAEIFADRKSFKIYPNPVKNNFVLQFKNASTDDMKVQIIDQNGEIKREFHFAKNQARSGRIYLSANGLSSGAYIIRVVASSWSQSIPILKL